MTSFPLTVWSIQPQEMPGKYTTGVWSEGSPGQTLDHVWGGLHYPRGRDLHRNTDYCYQVHCRDRQYWTGP